MSRIPNSGLQGRRGAGRNASRLLGVLVAVGLAGGCATKRDLKDLRTEIVVLQERQDSMFRVLQAQNDLMQDTLSASRAALVQVRGDVIRQLLSMEQQLFQIQELTGQSQRRLQELRQQYEQRSTQLTQPATPAQESATPASGADPEQLYSLGREQLERGNTSAARQAFQAILSSAPTHRLAPDAQFSLAETYAKEDPARALREFEQVQELFPNSPRAPAALFRAGVIARDRGDVPKAREYFQRVVRGYPRSDEAKAASEALGKLRS